MEKSNISIENVTELYELPLIFIHITSPQYSITNFRKKLIRKIKILQPRLKTP